MAGLDPWVKYSHRANGLGWLIFRQNEWAGLIWVTIFNKALIGWVSLGKIILLCQWAILTAKKAKFRALLTKKYRPLAVITPLPLPELVCLVK